jgi:hypothetical protein
MMEDQVVEVVVHQSLLLLEMEMFLPLAQLKEIMVANMLIVETMVEAAAVALELLEQMLLQVLAVLVDQEQFHILQDPLLKEAAVVAVLVIIVDRVELVDQVVVVMEHQEEVAMELLEQLIKVVAAVEVKEMHLLILDGAVVLAQ